MPAESRLCRRCPRLSAVSRPCRRSPGCAGGVPTMPAVARRVGSVPPMPAESRLCRRCLGHAGSVSACQQCPGHAGGSPGCGVSRPCRRVSSVPAMPAESRLCRRTPGCAGGVPAMPAVSRRVTVSQCLLIPPNPCPFRQFVQSRSRAPIVTAKGFRFNTGISRMTFSIGFIRFPEAWREPTE